jgi:hypothetical protein
LQLLLALPCELIIVRIIEGNTLIFTAGHDTILIENGEEGFRTLLLTEDEHPEPAVGGLLAGDLDWWTESFNEIALRQANKLGSDARSIAA